MNGITLLLILIILALFVVFRKERFERLTLQYRLDILGEVLPYWEQYLYAISNAFGGERAVEKWIEIVSDAYWGELDPNNAEFLQFVDYWIHCQPESFD